MYTYETYRATHIKNHYQASSKVSNLCVLISNKPLQAHQNQLQKQTKTYPNKLGGVAIVFTKNR